MQYLYRLLDLLTVVGKFLLKWTMFITLSIMLITQVMATLFMCMIVYLILKPLEIVFVFPLYYVFAGEKYYDNYYSVTDMFLDLIARDKIFWRHVDGESYYEHEKRRIWDEKDYYDKNYTRISNYKIRLQKGKYNE